MDKTTRILIVEDDHNDQRLLMHMLEKARLANLVEVVDDGEKALMLLRNYDQETDSLVAIFLDLNLPEMSGLQLLAKIREDERLRELPVIIMTTDISTPNLESCRTLGVSSFVHKPVTVASFTTAIANIFHAPISETTKLKRIYRAE